MSAICFNNVLKTKPKEQLENAATKAKDELAKAQKVLDEYKNKDLSDEKRQLNDKLARLDELNLYVGRVDKMSATDATIARLEARYGKEYQEIIDIVREKIDKENADEVLDISFAPKRSDESALGEKAQNLGIMSAENLEKGEKMSEIYDLKLSTPKDDKSLFYRRNDLKKSLKPFASKPLINKNDGRVAYISIKKIDKFGSDAALKTSKDNGFSEAAHFEAAKHLPELYENAKLREIQPDTKNGDPNVKIPRYEIAFTLDNEPAIAKITLKETLTGKFKGNKLYTIELESIAKLPNGL